MEYSCLTHYITGIISYHVHLWQKNLTHSRQALASDMSLVVGHKVSLPRDLKSSGQISPPSSCPGPLTKVRKCRGLISMRFKH